jgi:hypothetical protein
VDSSSKSAEKIEKREDDREQSKHNKEQISRKEEG